MPPQKKAQSPAICGSLYSVCQGRPSIFMVVAGYPPPPPARKTLQIQAGCPLVLEIALTEP